MEQSQSIKKYRELRRLGGGGMAEVFSAEMLCQQGYSKMVAVKRVLPRLAKNRRFIHMFLDEARLGLLLSHSNIVQVFDVGTSGDKYFIVMEHVNGVSLKDLWDRLPLEVSVAIVIEICRGLAYAHELRDWNGVPMNLVHHDVNPANVLLSIEGEVKLVDFGLAEAAAHLQQSDPDLVRGKFGYLSPEAALGMGPDYRADIFAVGVVLYELCTRTRPFKGGDDIESLRLTRAAVVTPPRERNPQISPALERVILHALARDRDQRVQTARQLGIALTEVLFEMGKPVSGFTVADMVQEEADRRAAREAAKRTAQIAGMIEEELDDFEPLGEDYTTNIG